MNHGTETTGEAMNSSYPAWEIISSEDESHCTTPCASSHTWIAIFFEDGRLAYWECQNCRITSPAEVNGITGNFERISAWIEKPPRLVSKGSVPWVSARKWLSEDGCTIVEGAPSSITFLGLRIPQLEEAYEYRKIKNDELVEHFVPGMKRVSLHGDHYFLTRFHVRENQLLQFESSCFEDSMYEIPNAKVPEKIILLDKLKPVTGISSTQE